MKTSLQEKKDFYLKQAGTLLNQANYWLDLAQHFKDQEGEADLLQKAKNCIFEATIFMDGYKKLASGDTRNWW